MTREPTIAGSTFLSAFTALTEAGIDETILEKEAGLTQKQLENPDIRIQVSMWNGFLEKARCWSGDPAFALHLGEKISHSRMSVVGHVVFNSRTVEDGIRQYIRFIRLANEGDRVELEENDDTAALVYITKDPSLYSPMAMERNFSLTVTRLRWYTNASVSPVLVEFRHPAPEYTDEYRRIFQSQVLFNREVNRMVFSKSILDLALSKRSAHLYSGLVNYAEALMVKLLRHRPVTRRVRKWIEKSLSDGEVGIETIADSMHMSRQTLYRKLKNEGANFKQLLDDIRKAHAITHLEQNEYSISEIAFLLGFSQISSFNRAFKRWYGQNPSDFRNQEG